jgi:GT2 family glycosyltransferase
MAAAFATIAGSYRNAVRRAATRRPVLRVVSPPQPFLSVVIVNYCQWRNTFRLTKSLRRSDAIHEGEAEIVVVDNHSPDHKLRRRLGRARGVTLQRFSRNQGFAKAVNAACRASQGDWILLLNPDVTASPDLLDQIDRHLRDARRVSADVGIIGLGVRNDDGTPQPSCGRLPTLARTLAGLFLPRSRRKCQALASAAEDSTKRSFFITKMSTCAGGLVSAAGR